MQVKVLQNAPREHSAILLTFIKLPFIIKTFLLPIFEWPLKTGFTVVKSSLAVGLAKFVPIKLRIFSYPSVLMYMFLVLKRTVSMRGLLSTHNLCFGGEIRKIIFDYTILTRGQYYLCCSNLISKKFPLLVSMAVGSLKYT